jgi:hypothetical protein
VLRTPTGRGDALADHAQPGPSAGRAGLAARLRDGHAGRLIARLLASIAACTLAVAAVGWQPAAYAVITGALTWLAVTSRADLAAAQPRR